jgi:hypothetical protein
MSQKEFYLIPRKDKLTKGKPTFYCRFRSRDGGLLPWRSTGFTSRTAAENWAIQEVKTGREAVLRTLAFRGFAEGWWTQSHSYVQGRLARGRDIVNCCGQEM